MIKIVLVQCKFILVEVLNITINFIPIPLRCFYLNLFGIKIGRHSTIHRRVKLFHIGKFYMGENSTINFGCY